MTASKRIALVGFFLLAPGAVSAVTTTPLESLPELTYPTHSVSMTAYNAVASQTDGDPMTTASGVRSNPEVVAARSSDLAKDLPFGTVIEVTHATSTNNCGYDSVDDQIGLRVIADAMHPRKRNQIDIMFDAGNTVASGGRQLNPAKVLGICKGVEIRIVGHIDIKKMPKDQAELRALLYGSVDDKALALAK